jgi:hypothetical protein
MFIPLCLSSDIKIIGRGNCCLLLLVILFIYIYIYIPSMHMCVLFGELYSLLLCVVLSVLFSTQRVRVRVRVRVTLQLAVYH